VEAPRQIIGQQGPGCIGLIGLGLVIFLLILGLCWMFFGQWGTRATGSSGNSGAVFCTQQVTQNCIPGVNTRTTP